MSAGAVTICACEPDSAPLTGELIATCLNCGQIRRNPETYRTRPLNELRAELSARDAEIERAWGALEPVDRGRSTLATVVSARLAQRDAEIERLRGQLHELRHRFEYSVMNDALVEARARVATLEAALREIAAGPHTDTCDAMYMRGCVCHVDIARTALESKP